MNTFYVQLMQGVKNDYNKIYIWRYNKEIRFVNPLKYLVMIKDIYNY